MINYDDIHDEDDDEIDEEFQRLIDILAPEQPIDEPPMVSADTLARYYEFLKDKLHNGLMLTGRESMGYFAWEEKFEFGYGSLKEYKELRKKLGAYQDKFKLFKLESSDDEYGIIARVIRIPDKKSFAIPLMDLEVCNEDLSEWEIVEDYSSWMVNFNDD